MGSGLSKASRKPPQEVAKGSVAPGASGATAQRKDEAPLSSRALPPEVGPSPAASGDAGKTGGERTGRSILRQMSMGGLGVVSDDLKAHMGSKGGLNLKDVTDVMQKHRVELGEKELTDLFDSCDANGDGTITVEEFEHQLTQMYPVAASEASYFEQMLQDAGVVQTLARALMERAEALDANDPIDAVQSKLTAEDFVKVLEVAKAEQALAFEKHCAGLRARRASERAAAEVNSKFSSGDGTFEGAYGDLADFLKGLDAIGLPQPRVYDGMRSEFNDSDDSDAEWKTSNYGGIVTTPKLEWEYVVCPDMTKVYPGGRIPTRLESFLYAVGAEGFKDLAEVTDPGERAEVEVVVLRRCKAQLDEQFLSKVLGRKVGKAHADGLVSKLDEALVEHNDVRQAQMFKDAAEREAKNFKDTAQGVLLLTQMFCWCIESS